MYEEPPHSKNFKPGELTVTDSDRNLNKDLRLSHVKEHDLLLLSETKLDLKGHTDIKKVATVEYLRSIILKPDVMMAVVTQKAQGGEKGSLVSLDCVVDVQKSFYLQMAEQEKSYSKFYVYFIEGLSVALREYKTIKASEFFGMASTLIQPTAPLANTVFSEEDKLRQSKMDDFITTHKDKFNQSQVKVLETILNMPE
jgi:hypothetical protein